MSDHETVTILADEVWDWTVGREPYFALRTGRDVESFPLRTLEEAETDAKRASSLLGRLHAVDPEGLSDDDRLRRQPSSGYTLTELRLATGPWGFDHTAVAPRVEFLSGDKDGGYRYAQKWADALPDAALTVLAGGHGALLKRAARNQVVAVMARLGAAASQR